MKEASFELIRTKKQMKACTTASILTFKYDEAEIYGDGTDFFLVSLEYPNEYRETKMVQAIEVIAFKITKRKLTPMERIEDLV